MPHLLVCVLLPQGKFNEVLNWLHQWHAELTKGEAEQG